MLISSWRSRGAAASEEERPSAIIRQYLGLPRNDDAAAAKAKFEALNKWVTERGGWLVSVPGAAEVTVECLPDSNLPNDLRALAYNIVAAGSGERILPHRIVERFVRRADGDLEPVTAGSTKPIAETRTHAGICKVKRYSLILP
jgi:hypothetical protein